jgi:SAM-dependent methyltransferase
MPDKPENREIRARSFGSVAAQYEHGRPGYSREAILWLLGSQPLEVLDLGAGTGKLSAAIAAAGHSVIALEPLAQMREFLTAKLPGVRVLDASAEEIPLESASVDAVLAGAAFHWFDQTRALPEILRVLRDPGILGLLGNGFDRSVGWVAHLGDLLGPGRLGRRGHWPSPEELGRYFDHVEEREFGHEQLVDLQTLQDLACSRSNIAILPQERREEILHSIAELWEAEPELAGRTSVMLPWRNNLMACRDRRRLNAAASAAGD